MNPKKSPAPVQLTSILPPTDEPEAGEEGLDADGCVLVDAGSELVLPGDSEDVTNYYEPVAHNLSEKLNGL